MPADAGVPQPRPGLARVERMVRTHLRSPVPRSTPRRAVTVTLLRETAAGLEAFLLERHSAMPFAAGQTVFPGGAVDPADLDVDAVTHQPALAHWADGFACTTGEAAALLAGAVREVFEEAGVLLALDRRTERPLAVGPELARWRAALVAGECGIGEVLAELGAVLSPALLQPWARWITPEWSARRYDTHFLVAVLPSGQRASDGSGEASAVAWRTPAEALNRAARGVAEMFTPTLETLRDLAELRTLEDVLGAERELRPTTFTLRTSPGLVEVFVERPAGRTPMFRFVP